MEFLEIIMRKVPDACAQLCLVGDAAVDDGENFRVLAVLQRHEMQKRWDYTGTGTLAIRCLHVGRDNRRLSNTGKDDERTLPLRLISARRLFSLPGKALLATVRLLNTRSSSQQEKLIRLIYK